jgi:hypothetical protein
MLNDFQNFEPFSEAEAKDEGKPVKPALVVDNSNTTEPIPDGSAFFIFSKDNWFVIRNLNQFSKNCSKILKVNFSLIVFVNVVSKLYQTQYSET